MRPGVEGPGEMLCRQAVLGDENWEKESACNTGVINWFPFLVP